MNHQQFTEPKTLDLVFEIGERQAKFYENSPILVAGNSKVGHLGPEGIMWVTRGISYWSCPGKTLEVGGCAKGCYAHFMVYLSLHRDADIGCGYTYLSFHDLPRLSRYLDRDLTVYAQSSLKQYVRVHDAGDYVSAEHVRMYRSLAEKHPNVQFWGMSHSWVIPAIAEELAQFNKLPNVLIRESTDPVRKATTGQAPQFHYDKKRPFVEWLKEQDVPAILCPSQFKRRAGRKMVPVTTCLSCQKCWQAGDRAIGAYEH